MHKHFSDAELARFAMDPDSIPRDRRQLLEQEATACPTCRTSLDFYSVISAEDLSELDEPDTSWANEDPMRDYVARIAEEDREADEILEQEKLLTSPTRTAWTNPQRNRRLLTGGVVRRLNAHANSIYEFEPLDALTYADAAIVIAETLADDTYPWSAVFELRGTAWKERANALLMLGDYPPALDALAHAERAYRQLQSSGFGLATVALVRASVLYGQGLFDEAVTSAEKAEHGFAFIGQEERRMRALFLRASIKYERREIPGAIALFDQVLEYGETINNPRWIARASYAIGNCQVEAGHLSDATMYFHRALVIFRGTGPEPDRIATEWGLARVVLHAGSPDEAIPRLRNVAAEYERRSMITDAALVRLDIVEALLTTGNAKQIMDIAARLFRIFRDAGMMTGALTAMAYMKEAAAAGKLTSTSVNTLRTYLRHASRQPNLIFVPPPDSFK